MKKSGDSMARFLLRWSKILYFPIWTICTVAWLYYYFCCTLFGADDPGTLSDFIMWLIIFFFPPLVFWMGFGTVSLLLQRTRIARALTAGDRLELSGLISATINREMKVDGGDLAGLIIADMEAAGYCIDRQNVASHRPS
jgi:hypothetical protein